MTLEELAATDYAQGQLFGAHWYKPESLAEILKPDWDIGGRVHNWRNHVPDGLQVIWDRLSDDAKVVSYLVAEEAANNEHWD